MTETPKALPAPEKQKTCFVVMPIADMQGYEPSHFSRVYANIIKPACELAGFRPVRADEVQNAGMIHIDILNNLLDADMVICDLSGKNPNVMFELGIRQAFDKPVVLIQEIGTGRIFDISPMRCIDYDKNMRYDSVVPVQKKISDCIKETYDKKDSGENINSIVRLLSVSRAAELPKASGSSEENMFHVLKSDIESIKDIILKQNRKINNPVKIINDRDNLQNIKSELIHIKSMISKLKNDSSLSNAEKSEVVNKMYINASNIFELSKIKDDEIEDIMTDIRNSFIYYSII
ncbi:MAG: hypothetical protein AB7D19_11235 [Acetobacter sp.]|uniref:hypothetical protein n=1 Tax=Acetobacter sp. TaxID=440 RepID=UPI003D086C70